jgi:hypothetical protein
MSTNKIPKNIEDLQNFKNMFDNNVIELIKPSIKEKSNEKVLKFIEIIKERPEYWFEFISISIFHQNFQIMKYMIETFRIKPTQNPTLNALSFYNNILPDNSDLIIKDQKELYIDFDCPLILQACIGGDEEIFFYLMKHQFGKNLLNLNGIIGLSKKQKNAFTSNVIGACSYYGRYKLLNYLIQNYKFDLNFFSSEKKAKNKHSSFIKEYTNLTPISLSILSEISSDDDIIKIIKLLFDAKASLNESDCNGNNILHIAVKSGKINIIKFLIEELNLKNLSNQINKNGQTPLAIAQNLKNNDIIDYLKKQSEVSNEKLEEDLLELIQSTNKKNEGKKKKGKKNNDIPLLNTSSYKETLQISTSNDKRNNENNQKDLNNNLKMDIKNEENEEENENENEENKEEEEEEEEIGQKYQLYKKDNSYGYRNKNYYNYNDNKNYYYDKRGYNNYYNKTKKYNYNDSYNNKNRKNNSYYNYYEKGNNIEVEITDNYNPIKQEYNSFDNKKFYNYENDNFNYKRKNKYNNRNDNFNVRKEKEKEGKKIDENKTNINSEDIKLKNKIEIEPKIETPITEMNKEEDEIKKEEKTKIEIEKKIEIERPKNDYLNEELEQSNEDEGYDDDFLQEDENEQEKNLNSQNQNPIKNDLDYINLYNKYIQLEKQFETISKEKEELENYVINTYLFNKRNTQTVISNEENINDLINLANKELEEKNKIIGKLNNKLALNDLSNIQNFSLSKLKELKEKFSENLKKINEAVDIYNK